MWQAEADNVSSLGSGPNAVEPGQILLEYGSMFVNSFTDGQTQYTVESGRFL